VIITTPIRFNAAQVINTTNARNLLGCRVARRTRVVPIMNPG
jgi:hypothetical protein